MGIKVSVVRVQSETEGFDRTFVVKHPDEVDPGEVFSRLIAAAPEMKKQADEGAIRLHKAMVEAYPKRVAAWKTSKAICEVYETFLHDYEKELLAYDELKMSGKVTEMSRVLTEPERPSAEHYPLPPMPEDPGELELIPFDGSFKCCVESLQNTDFEKSGLRVILIEDGVSHIEITHGR